MAETDVSRRDFLKGAGTLGLAAGAAGVVGSAAPVFADEGAETGPTPDLYQNALPGESNFIPVKKAECPGPIGPIAFEEREIPESEIARTDECEVLVIGCGIGGLMGSLKAAEEGAQVIALEKMTEGRAAWESLGAYNAKVQQEAGVEVDPAQLTDEILRSAYWRTRPDPTLTYVYRSGEAADFLSEMLDKGESGIKVVKYDQMPINNGFPLIDSYLTFAIPPEVSITWLFGLWVCQDLVSVASGYENLDMRFETPAVQLVQDESGRVAGCIAKSGNEYIKINASKGILLATGGYDSNPEMMEAWVRPEDYATSSWWNPSWGTTGDGHMMGLKIGAQMDPLPQPVMNFNYGTPHSFIEMGTFFPAAAFAILVNGEGKRFVNEDLQMNCVSNAINAQPGYGTDCWHIFDEGMLSLSLDANPSAAGWVTDYEEKGWLFSADTPQELADLIGIDGAGLADSLQSYSSNFEKGLERDAEFYRYLGATMPFTGGKLYALTTNSVILATVGGLTINGKTQVLNTEDQVIEGLYATGNASGNFFSGTYPRHIPGTSVGRAVTFSYVAIEEMLKGGN